MTRLLCWSEIQRRGNLKSSLCCLCRRVPGLEVGGRWVFYVYGTLLSACSLSSLFLVESDWLLWVTWHHKVTYLVGIIPSFQDWHCSAPLYPVLCFASLWLWGSVVIVLYPESIPSSVPMWTSRLLWGDCGWMHSARVYICHRHFLWLLSQVGGCW